MTNHTVTKLPTLSNRSDFIIRPVLSQNMYSNKLNEFLYEKNEAELTYVSMLYSVFEKETDWGTNQYIKLIPTNY